MAQEEKNFAALAKLAEAAASGNLAVLDEVFAPNVVDHDPAPDQEPGADGYKRFFSGLRAVARNLTGARRYGPAYALQERELVDEGVVFHTLFMNG